MPNTPVKTFLAISSLALASHLVFGLPAQTEVIPATADSFERVLANAKPGAVVELADGLYRDVNIRFVGRGEPDRPITLRASHPGRVVFTGSSWITISGQHLVLAGLLFDQAWGNKVVEFSGARHCRLTDCTFLECGDPDNTFSHVVYLLGSSDHNRVDHCLFEGSLSMSVGIRIAEGDADNTDNHIDHNHFRDIVRRSTNGQEAVQIGQGKFSSLRVARTLVESCLFERASGDDEIISNKSCGNTYRRNTFRDCRGSLTLRSGGSVLVQENIFIGCEMAVLVHASHSAIVGNVSDGCGHGIVLDLGHGPNLDVSGHMTAHHCLIANNLIRNAKSSAIRIGHRHTGTRASASQAPFANLFVNNLLSGPRGPLLRIETPDTNQWRAVSLWADGPPAPANPLPEGVRVEPLNLATGEGQVLIPSGRTGRAREFWPEIQPLLAAMAVPRNFDDLFPPVLSLRVLQPAEVGPTWLAAIPTGPPRQPNRRPIPPLPSQPKSE